MTNSNDSFLDELNQIRERQADVLDEIDRIKENRSGSELRDIEQIQSNALKIIFEIDEIKDRVRNRLDALIEQSTILYRMQTQAPTFREKIGSVWV